MARRADQAADAAAASAALRPVPLLRPQHSDLRRIMSLHFQMKGDCGENIYKILAFSSCMISSTIRSLQFQMKGDYDKNIYESLACSMSLYPQMETDCSENNL